MLKLSIDEVIAHCNRTVERFENFSPREKCENWSLDSQYGKEYWEHRQVAVWLEELKSYKDAEEQGLLLRLPIAIGSEFLELNYACKEPYIYSRIAHQLHHCVYVMEHLGKTAFLTREEAEQALAEMKG